MPNWLANRTSNKRRLFLHCDEIIFSHGSGSISRMRISALSRREFLQSTGAAAALIQVAPGMLLGQAGVSAGVEAVPAWASKPMRWAQLTLVEDDPAHFDGGFWLDYFK